MSTNPSELRDDAKVAFRPNRSALSPHSGFDELWSGSIADPGPVLAPSRAEFSAMSEEERTEWLRWSDDNRWPFRIWGSFGVSRGKVVLTELHVESRFGTPITSGAMRSLGPKVRRIRAERMAAVHDLGALGNKRARKVHEATSRSAGRPSLVSDSDLPEVARVWRRAKAAGTSTEHAVRNWIADDLDRPPDDIDRTLIQRTLRRMRQRDMIPTTPSRRIKGGESRR